MTRGPGGPACSRRTSYGTESRAVSSSRTAPTRTAARWRRGRRSPTSRRGRSTVAPARSCPARPPPRCTARRLRRCGAPFHVTVPRGRNVQRAHHHIHTTTELPLDRPRAGRRPSGDVGDARLIDLARFVSPESADARRSTRPCVTAARPRHALHRRIVDLRSSGRYGIPKLLAVIEGCEVTRGGHSWLERRYLELCAEAGLPRPVDAAGAVHERDRLVRVDCRFPGHAGRRRAARATAGTAARSSWPATPTG